MSPPAACESGDGRGGRGTAPGVVDEALETVDGREEDDEGAEPAEETDDERACGLAAGGSEPLPFTLAETGEPVRCEPALEDAPCPPAEGAC